MELTAQMYEFLSYRQKIKEFFQHSAAKFPARLGITTYSAKVKPHFYELCPLMRRGPNITSPKRKSATTIPSQRLTTDINRSFSQFRII